MMTKILRIERCNDCPFIRWQASGPDGYCQRVMQDRRGYIYDVLSIPSWCPLPDAPAWPSVPEVDEERDECAFIEAPAVLTVRIC